MKAGALADPVAMEVFSNRLLSITEEMGSNLMSRCFRDEPCPLSFRGANESPRPEPMTPSRPATGRTGGRETVEFRVHSFRARRCAAPRNDEFGVTT